MEEKGISERPRVIYAIDMIHQRGLKISCISRAAPHLADSYLPEEQNTSFYSKQPRDLGLLSPVTLQGTISQDHQSPVRSHLYL